jgi:flagellar basal-body rod modification protein FlgD
MTTITSTPVPTAAANPAATAASGANSNAMIADNFQTFLTLLTTQLKNQNPLDPLDTNQFTQQLVQFAQVEQQMKSNDQLNTLVSLEKNAQSTTALAFVGATVVVDGSTAPLSNGSANWTLNVTKPSTATVTIKDSTGQTAYSGTFGVNPGNQTFTWDGRGNDGRLWPDGKYTLTATGVDANKQPVAISTEVQAQVDSVDLTQNPPLLSINGQNYTLDKIKRIVRPGLPVASSLSASSCHDCAICSRRALSACSAACWASRKHSAA